MDKHVNIEIRSNFLNQYKTKLILQQGFSDSPKIFKNINNDQLNLIPQISNNEEVKSDINKFEENDFNKDNRSKMIFFKVRTEDQDSENELNHILKNKNPINIVNEISTNFIKYLSLFIFLNIIINIKLFFLRN